MQKLNRINLALSFDENYVTPVYVLLASIFLNNTSKSTFHFHFIATGISGRETDELRKYIQRNNAEVSFYSISPNNLEGLVLPEKRHYTIAAYYKLFFPLLLPKDETKLLYLDVDIVVKGDLSELYVKQLTSFPLGAVPELFHTKAWPHLGIHETGKYFNSGVLLINLPEWRKQKVTEKALQFVNDFPEKIAWVDQDALNAVLLDNYLALDLKYNVNTYDIPANRTRAEYKRYASDKVIIHYTTYYKPWNVFSRHPLRNLYFEYLQSSPRRGSKKYTNFKFTPKILWYLIKLNLKERLLEYPGLIKH